MSGFFAPRRWLRWLKHLFVTFHALLYASVLAGAALLYVVFRPDGLVLLNTYVFEPMGLSFERAEGSLIEGFTLHNIRSDSIFAKQLTLDYNLTRILEGDHVVESVKIDGLRIHLDNFTGGGDTPWPLPLFRLNEVSLTNVQLISVYPVEFDLEGSEGTYDGDLLNLKTLRATIKSHYAGASIEGTLRNNAIRGRALLYPDPKALAPYSGRFTDLPRSLAVEIEELSDTRALLHTRITELFLKQDPSLRAKGMAIDFDYRYDNDFFDTSAAYTLERGNETMATIQQLRYRFDGTTTTSFDGLIHASHPLPSDKLHGEITDDINGLSGKLQINGGTLLFSSDDYDRFRWDLDSRHDSLAFIPKLPEILQNSPFRLWGQGEFVVSKNLLKGRASLEHNHGNFEATFDHSPSQTTAQGTLRLPPDAPSWKNWSHKPPETIQLSLLHENNATSLKARGDAFSFSVRGNPKNIVGSGNYAENTFDLIGSIKEHETELLIDSRTPSLFALANRLNPITLHKGEFYDAEVRTKTRVNLGDTFRLHTDVTIPWYAVILDSQRSFGGTDGSFSLDYQEGNITLERYRLEIAGHTLTTPKRSALHLKDDGTLVLDQVWLFDTLRLTGTVAPDLRTSLRLFSDRFSYDGPEGNAQARADITFTRDADANQKLSGEIEILDASITYLPLQQFKVMDDDIIIVQDVRPPSAIKFAMNLHVIARRPIHYQTKELDVRLNPDLTLWKDPLGPIQILGMITIPSGYAETAGKQFEIKHSEIYFGGDIPLNPYLNLTIGHEVDYKKILIYVTHRLDSPIFLFASDPVMSQNDIMSYILFGTPANTSTTGEASTSSFRADATNFMLGAGLKGLIKGATRLQIDTMNILTTKQGGMGFEVGARLNKDLRVLYKNDTLSSVLVQYAMNRWLRLDVDIHELGQGVNFVYIKDFKDFLPHNEPKKKKGP